MHDRKPVIVRYRLTIVTALLQDAAGNLPHLHLLAKLEKQISDEEARNRIECATSRIHDIGDGLTVSEEDSEKLVAEGLLERPEEWVTYYSDYERIQSHSCERADFRCHKRRKVVSNDNSGTERIISECRVPQYPPSYSDSFERIHAPHSGEALEVLLRVGLASRGHGSNEIVVGAELEAGRHQYSADVGQHVSPTVPRLFLATRSSSNVQVCDKYFNSRYLSKYLCGAEERASVDARPDPNGVVTINVDRIRNRKLGRHRMRESRLGKRKWREDCRLVASTETCWWVFDLPYIITDEDFIACPTRPLSQRSGRTRKRYARDLSEASGVDHRRDIEGLSENRQYTENQRLLYRSALLSECSIDNLVAFQLRPPELRFVDNPVKFLEWFTWKRAQNGQDDITEDLRTSPWVDCFSRQWRIRESAIEAVQLWAIESDDSIGYDVYRQVLQNIEDTSKDDPLYKRFVDNSKSGKKRGIVVTSLPKPSNVLGFLVHILLSRGHFTTELDLYAAGSMTEAFRVAGLIPRERNPEPADVDALLRSYIVDDLMYHPFGGTRGFDTCIIGADRVLRSLLLENEIAYNEVPIVEEEELCMAGIVEARPVQRGPRAHNTMHDDRTGRCRSKGRRTSCGNSEEPIRMGA